MATGLTVVSAANLCDASGEKISDAKIFFQPVLSKGRAASFGLGTAGGGVVMAPPVSADVVDGAFSIVLADTTLTTPVNIGYAVSVIDNESGCQLLGDGYGFVQPFGLSWSLDTYQPSVGNSTLLRVGIGTVTTLPPGSQATVTNSGVNGATVLNFGLPAGNLGLTGPVGAAGASAYQIAVAGGYGGSQSQWLQSLVGATGDAGLSAYQVAVAGGYSGSAAQWLASLVGATGAAGLSAYQIAVAGGYVGSQSQWVASLAGAPGATGATGLSAYQIAVAGGYSGTQSQWLASLIGATGPAGLSAYQVAVNSGFSGSQSQWLASLVGANGSAGLSAYQIAVAAGFSGSQAQWLASLVGPAGATGPAGAAGAVGPAGPAGPPGPATGGNGIVLVDAVTSAPMTLGVLNGRLAVVSTAPVLIDQITGALFQVGVASDENGVSHPTFTGVSSAMFPVHSLTFTDLSSTAQWTLTMANGRYQIA